MFNIARKFIQHGIVTINYPDKPAASKFITGKPEIDASKCIMCGECSVRCPSSAISGLDKKEGYSQGKQTEKSILIDINRCIFCSLCADICPSNAIIMTNNFEMASKIKDEPGNCPVIVKDDGIPEYDIIGKQLKENIRRVFGRSLHIREVDAGSCNGCDNEANAMNGPYNDVERLGISFVASPRHADMLLVTGPVSRNMELALVKTYNATPDPKLVVSVGACACSGGIFRDSYAVRDGVDRIIPVDVYIPGCPPRPQAIIYGILKAIEKL